MRMQNPLAAQADAAAAAASVASGVLLDRTTTRASGLPDDARAVIQCPAPSAMSGGRRRAAEWVLTFEPRARPFIEPLMGWTGGTDTLSQVRLRFPSRDAAIGYARRNGLPYEVREPGHLHRGDLARVEGHALAAEDPVPPEMGWAWDTPHSLFERGAAMPEFVLKSA
jgi:hypothetical protein